MNSFFVEIENVKINDLIKLNSSEHNHLANVLRMKVGEIVQVYPNDNRILLCEIKEITKRESVLVVKDIQEAKTNPKNRVDVFTALLKGDKFEFLITKLTELGVTTLIPFESEFCIGKNVGNKAERHTQIAKDACKQCKRAKTINVLPAMKFYKMLESLVEYDIVLFAYEKDCNNSLTNRLELVKKDMKVAIIVGSEGGFSEQEAKEIENAGGLLVSLGSRILRAETASLMLSTLVLNKLEEYELKNS